MSIEIAGGVLANSLAIITDAAHMLSDVGGFIISLIGLELAEQVATSQYTFGFKQAEVLGAFLSIMIVWGLTAVLLFEAVQRFTQPEAIDGPIMCLISVVGFLVNLVLMKVLGHGHSHGGGHGGHGHSHGGHGHSNGNSACDDGSPRRVTAVDNEESIAVRAAMAHVIGDIVQSLGVCLASLLIWFGPKYLDIGEASPGVSNWCYADPMCTVLFGVLVLLTTKATIMDALNKMMVKAPSHIDQEKFSHALCNIPHVESTHDLHVWMLGSQDVLCTCHIMVDCREHAMDVLKAAIKLSNKAGMHHSTFQIEIVGEFDPALETYGTLHENPVTTVQTGSFRAISNRDLQGSKDRDLQNGHGHVAHGGEEGHGHEHGHAH